MICALLFAVLAAPTLVWSAIDGDTVAVRVVGANIEERIRVANIDAPEVRGPACEAERAAGEAARAHAQALLDAAARVEVLDHEGRSHGRRNAWLWLVDAAGMGRDFGRVMIDAGHARPYVPGWQWDWCAQTRER